MELQRTSKEIFIWGWASLKPLVIAQGGLCTLAFMYTQLWSFGHTKFSTWLPRLPSSVCTAKEIGNNPLLQPQALSGNLILLFNFTGNKFPSWREISSCEREENVSATHLTREWTYYDIEVNKSHLVFQKAFKFTWQGSTAAPRTQGQARERVLQTVSLNTCPLV